MNGPSIDVSYEVLDATIPAKEKPNHPYTVYRLQIEKQDANAKTTHKRKEVKDLGGPKKRSPDTDMDGPHHGREAVGHTRFEKIFTSEFRESVNPVYQFLIFEEL